MAASVFVLILSLGIKKPVVSSHRLNPPTGVPMLAASVRQLSPRLGGRGVSVATDLVVDGRLLTGESACTWARPKGVLCF